MGCFHSKLLPPVSGNFITRSRTRVEQHLATATPTLESLTAGKIRSIDETALAESKVDATKHPVLAFAAAAASEEIWNGPILTCDMLLQTRKPGSTQVKLNKVALPYNPKVFTDAQFGPLIGEGGFGTVYKGTWHGEQVAIKLVKYFDDACIDEGMMVEDIAEAKLLQGLSHPGIVKLYAYAIRVETLGSNSSAWSLYNCDICDHALETWLLLEYCDKGTLQKAIECGWFKEKSPQGTCQPNLARILAIALETSLAMEYLHHQDIIHGDLSTGNVLLANSIESPHGFATKIADFGFSRHVTSTVWTSTYGTVTHMAPELIEDGRLTKSADVFSFGVLLWSMFSGLPAWHGMTMCQVIYHIGTRGASLDIPAQCPGVVKDMLEACMSKNYESRPTFSALSEELRSMERMTFLPFLARLSEETALS